MSELGDASPLSRKTLIDTGCVVSRLCRPTALDGALGVPEDSDGFTPSRTTREKKVDGVERFLVQPTRAWELDWKVRNQEVWSGVGETSVLSLCVLCRSVFVVMMYVLCWSVVRHGMFFFSTTT